MVLRVGASAGPFISLAVGPHLPFLPTHTYKPEYITHSALLAPFPPIDGQIATICQIQLIDLSDFSMDPARSDETDRPPLSPGDQGQC